MTTVFEKASETLSKYNLVLGSDTTFTFDNKYNVSIDTAYVKILGDTITVRAGYAWNGLDSKYFQSSKFVQFAVSFLKKVDTKLTDNGLPHLWQATLLYDVFQQYRTSGQLPAAAMSLALDLFSKFLASQGVSAWVIAMVTTAIQVFGTTGASA